jgi:hypothetical protein
MAIIILCFMVALILICASWVADSIKLFYAAAVFICVGYGIIVYQVKGLF